MKKAIIVMLALLAVSVFSSTAYAMDFGSLESVQDTLTPDGKDAIIHQKITAVTNENGEIAFPLYSKTEMISIESEKGSILEAPKTVEYGDHKFNVVVFSEKEAEVSFEVIIRKAGVYTGKKAKLGDTFPSGALTIEHKVVNSSPNAIKSYSVKMAAPEGKELLNIVGYDAEEAFGITKEDGTVFGGFDFEEVDAGQEVKLAINIFSPMKIHSTLVWILSGLISVAFMVKNKDLLKGKAAMQQ